MIGSLLQSVIVLGLVITGLVSIVHPPAAGEVAKRAGKVTLILFAVNAALSYLWSDRIGRLLLITILAYGMVKLVIGQKE